ncbi:FAD:protein FMN transferase [Bacillus smithii]
MHSNLNKKKFVRRAIFMDTFISVIVVTSSDYELVQNNISKVFEIFHTVESVCNRFDSNSELRKLSTKIGTPIKVSEILFQALSFSCEVARITNGAFDPTLGYLLEAFGFNKSYLTRKKFPSNCKSETLIETSFRDIVFDEEKRTVMLLKPLLLDLGAVAKGLAIDLARKQLDEFEGYCIDAGGDVFVKGCNENNEPWHIGIRNPKQTDQIICSLRVSDAAVCTSGSYERRNKGNKDIHHLIDPVSHLSSHKMLSCTAISPFAMMADAFSTSVFILGQEKGLSLMEDYEVDGVIVTPTMEIKTTKGIERYQYEIF